MIREIFLSLVNGVKREEYDTQMRYKDSLHTSNLALIQENKTLNEMVEDLNAELIQLKFDCARVDLSKFETSKARKINGRYMLISKWLSDTSELQIVKDWVVANLKYSHIANWSDDKFVIEIRKAIYKHFGSKDNHVPEKVDTWQKPSDFIKNKFKGDCDDWATFLHYVYQALSELHNRPRIKDNLYLVLCGINTKEGWNWGNHASLVWKHSDEKFYVLESAVKNGSDYIQDSINRFGMNDYTQNVRYGRIVFMSNSEKNYYKVIL